MRNTTGISHFDNFNLILNLSDLWRLKSIENLLLSTAPLLILSGVLCCNRQLHFVRIFRTFYDICNVLHRMY